MAPANRLSRLPSWLSYWLGYRSAQAKASEPLPLYLVCTWSFIGGFCGLAVILATFGHSQYFIERQVPPIVASYGASAVLCYGAIEAPFSQPRALIGGHFISALVGLCITKLFRFLPSEQYSELLWLIASLCTAVAIVAMQLTKTTHPPAGATALLPATSPEIWSLSWYFLPIVLLSSVFVLITALIINNIQRRYPVFWISPSVPRPEISPAKDTDRMEEINREEVATETAYNQQATHVAESLGRMKEAGR
ncbi:hypothetical protein MMC10_009586 [Thelotrema lepadinum]|nr:hypothetical protein [Thelotrema lepadinum]